MPFEKQFDRQEVLGRALDAFWVRGFEATSMQTLVDSMGINRGSLYATFGDKRALFREALQCYDEQRQRMLAELETRYGPREAIRRLFSTFTDGVREKGGNKGCFMANTALELAAHDSEIGDVVAEAQKDVEAFFARMISKGQAEGEISAGIEPEEAAKGLLASLLGVMVLIRSQPDRALLSTIVDDAMRRLD